MTIGSQLVDAARKFHGASFIFAQADVRDGALYADVCVRGRRAAKLQTRIFRDAKFTEIDMVPLDGGKFIVKAKHAH